MHTRIGTTTHMVMRSGVIWAALLVGMAGIGDSRADGFDLTPELRALIDAKDYAGAEKEALAAAEVDPVFISWLRAKQGKVDEAVNYLEDARPIDMSSESAPEAVASMVEVIGDASNADAISLLDKYLQNEALARSSALWLLLLRLYALSPDPEKGEDTATRVLSLNPSAEELLQSYYMYCVALYEDGENALALKHYEELRKRVPVALIDPGYQLQFAHILTAGGRPLDSLKIIDDIRSDFADYAQANKSLLLVASALAYEALGDRKSATRDFETIVESGDSGAQGAQFVPLAKDKLRNFAEDEAARQLTDDSPDVVEEELTYQSGRTLRVIFVGANVILVIVLAGYLIVRRRRGEGK